MVPTMMTYISEESACLTQNPARLPAKAGGD